MKKAFLFLTVIFVVNAVGLYNGWYQDFFWFDIILHFLGGFFVAMLMANYLNEYFVNKKILKNVFIIVSATVFIGVVWEFSEYIANLALSPIIYERFAIRTYFMGNIDDTIGDLLVDILGALFFSFLHFLGSRKTHKI